MVKMLKWLEKWHQLKIEGLAEYNVIGCAKHFPGHGDTANRLTLWITNG